MVSVMHDPSHSLPPWTRGALRITSDVLARIEAEAEASYPNEACGLLRGPRDVPDLLDEALPMDNLADRYHALDPEAFPRTARTYFKLDELRAARFFEEGERTGRPVKVVYHSHCDAGAYFSEEDAATFALDGRLAWPVAFVVLSVRAGRVAARKLWCHVPGTSRFEEHPLGVHRGERESG